MSIHRRMATLLVAVMALALLVTGVAFGASAGQGYDYSYSYNGNKQVAACDAEADGRYVYSDFQAFSGAWGSVGDGNGSNSGCGGSGYYNTGISRHDTCEAINNWPDACSGWSWH